MLPFVIIWTAIFAILLFSANEKGKEVEMAETQQAIRIEAGEENKEEVEAYFAWCKLNKRWDIRLDEWRRLKNQGLLPK